MLSKKVKSRIFYLIFTLVTATVILFIILRSLEDNVVYFFSPTEIYNKPNILLNNKIRLGGLVKKGSIQKKEKIYLKEFEQSQTIKIETDKRKETKKQALSGSPI